MFYTMYNRPQVEKNLPSDENLTVPDQAFTPREILAKYSRGESINLGRSVIFDDDPDFIDPTRNAADIQDVLQMKLDNDESLEKAIVEAKEKSSKASKQQELEKDKKQRANGSDVKSDSQQVKQSETKQEER